MEERQREYIANNLDRLVRQTCCSTELLTCLEKDEIITKTDIELLVRKETKLLCTKIILFNYVF